MRAYLNLNGDVVYRNPYRSVPEIPAGARALDRPEYDYCHYYHYSNPESQNALICQTADFPDYVEPHQEHSHAYSDRLRSWDSKHYSAICEMAGTGEQGWQQTLPRKSDAMLCVFAQFALKLPVLPLHVRIVHWYNVSTGYSCPTIEAIYDKTTVTPTS